MNLFSNTAMVHNRYDDSYNNYYNESTDSNSKYPTSLN